VNSRSLADAELHKPAKFFGQDLKVENIYLRILVHNDEHMGQSIAYARMNGILPATVEGQADASIVRKGGCSAHGIRMTPPH
jgi:hypothetical protein